MQKPFDFVAVLLAILVCTITSAHAQEKVSISNNRAPFSVGTQKDVDFEKRIVDSAKSTLNAGMPSLAKAILEDNFKNSDALKKSKRANEIYIDTLIALGNFSKAQEILNTIDKNSTENQIREALVKCGLGEAELVKTGIEKIDPKQVPEHLRSWLSLAKGYALFEEGKNNEALKEFEYAKSISKSSGARVDAEVGINIAKLATASSNVDLEKLEKQLQEKVAVFIGTKDGFQFAKQYASILFRLGKEKEALDVINQQLEISLAPDLDKDELRLIRVAMTKDSQKQKDILIDLLNQTSTKEIAEFAIDLLAENKSISPEGFKDELEKFSKNTTFEIKDKILLEQAENAIKMDNRAEVKTYAEKLLTDFPNSKYKANALQTLAWTAWENNQYRFAATNLVKLAELQQSEQAKNEIMYVAASCYFLDKDFATAANIYEQIFDKIPQKQGAILNKIIDAYLEQNNESKALSILNKAHKNKSIDENELWNAEWKIISLYKNSGNTEKALNRIDQTIATTSDGAPLLKMKMMWLRAIISERAKNYQRTIQFCDNIIDMETSEEIGNSDIEKKTAKEIAASTLLLKAACLEKIATDIDNKESIATYEKIRKLYPDTEAAPLSYLYQARLEAELGHYVAANRLCTELADNKNYSHLKYEALFDVALYTKKIATDLSYKLALNLLKQLQTDFPNEPRNFYARISQAEILRLINAFADARKIYNELINKFGDHPEIYLAWLGLGDCSLAQGKFVDAQSIFERIYSLPGMPLAARAEAAHKCSFALEKSGRVVEANRIAWSTANAIIDQMDNDDLTKYWVGKLLYELAQSLEDQGQKDSARAVYELLIKRKLPSYKIAEEKIKLSTKK